MPRVPVVPLPELAVAYIEAVEQGRWPVKDMCERFDLSYEMAEKRSWRLRRFGWLPRGMPNQQEWLEQARAMVEQRLSVLAERELTQHRRLQERVRRARAALEREQREASRPPVQMRRAPAPPRRAKRGQESVLDLFG